MIHGALLQSLIAAEMTTLLRFCTQEVSEQLLGAFRAVSIRCS